MATINTNMSAKVASNSLVRNDRTMGATMERLSTGLRINSAKDDAAGLAISNRMDNQVRGLQQLEAALEILVRVHYTSGIGQPIGQDVPKVRPHLLMHRLHRFLPSEASLSSQGLDAHEQRAARVRAEQPAHRVVRRAQQRRAFVSHCMQSLAVAAEELRALCAPRLVLASDGVWDLWKFPG